MLHYRDITLLRLFLAIIVLLFFTKVPCLDVDVEMGIVMLLYDFQQRMSLYMCILIKKHCQFLIKILIKMKRPLPVPFQQTLCFPNLK